MHKYTHQVHYYETDKMGITHHSNYIRWMEEARIDFLNHIGYSYAKLEEIGLYSPVVGVECKFKSPTTFEDLIEVWVWVEELRPAKFIIGYEMKKDDVIVCTGTTEHGFVNREGHVVNLKRVYPEFYEILVKEGRKDNENS